jgi:hypothetical protein
MSISNVIKQSIETNLGWELDLSNCGFFDEDVPELVNLISKNSKITEVCLSCNNITNKSFQYLLKLNIKKLDISSNHIDDGEECKEIMALAKSRLEHLDLRDNGLSNKSAKIFAENSNQIFLNLARNPSINQQYIEQVKVRINGNKEHKRNEKIKENLSFLHSTAANTQSSSSNMHPEAGTVLTEYSK